MANPTIGFINCAFSGEKSEVRKDKKGKLYYYNENTGMIKPNLIAGQAYMKKHTRFIGENGEPLPPVERPEYSVNENKPVIRPEVKPEVKPDFSVNENKPVRKSFLSMLIKDE